MDRKSAHGTAVPESKGDQHSTTAPLGQPRSLSVVSPRAKQLSASSAKRDEVLSVRNVPQSAIQIGQNATTPTSDHNSVCRGVSAPVVAPWSTQYRLGADPINSDGASRASSAHHKKDMARKAENPEDIELPKFQKHIVNAWNPKHDRKSINLKSFPNVGPESMMYTRDGLLGPSRVGTAASTSCKFPPDLPSPLPTASNSILDITFSNTQLNTSHKLSMMITAKLSKLL